MNETIKLSISEILQLEGFRSSTVISGHSQLERRINRVNIVVDPDIIKFIHPGEFLLSTSFFFKSMTIEEQIDFIQTLSNRGIACLGIKFSPQMEWLEEAVIAHARKLSFVIFSIDFNESFTTLISQIYETIFDRQVDVLNKITQVHDRAMALLSEGGDIYDIIKTLEEASDSRVLIIDNYYDQVFTNPDLEDPSAFVESVAAFRNNHRRNPITHGELKSVTIHSEVHQRYIFPMYVKNEIYGYIVAFTAKNAFLEMKQQLVESVSTVASLYFYNQLSIEEVEMSYRSEFLENLISGDSRRKKKALDRALFFNMNPVSRYQILRFQFDESTNDGQEVIRHLHQIRTLLKSYDAPTVLAIINNQINLLIQLDHPGAETLLMRLEESNAFGMSGRLIMGRIVYGLDQVEKSFGDCDKILQHPGLMGELPVVAYERMGIQRLLIEEVLEDEIRTFYRAHLKVLVDYDNKRGTNLVDTLRAYFTCNGNLRKMSEVLYTHYNTILYRIERIEAITGKKLDDEESRFNLHTSLKILDLIHQG